MLRALPIAVILLASSPAAADGFLVELQAPSSVFRGDLARHVTTDATVGIDGGAFALGWRSETWAGEILVMGHDLLATNGGGTVKLVSGGAALRRYVPIGERIDLTARAAVDRSKLVAVADTPLADYGGLGVLASAGIAVSAFHDGARLQILAEVFRHDVWLDGPGKDIDGSISGVMIGLALSPER